MIHIGDCLEVMPRLDAASVDSIVCDPPYGLGFMGKAWDHGVPGEPFWREALRVAKPGAFLVAFGGTRTFHRLACAIEDAGWEIRDTLMWVYGSGFPKSLDVSKAIDKAAGAKRTEVIGRYQPPGMEKPWNLSNAADERNVEAFASSRNNLDILAPATEAARKWEGWGTALKPAWEPILLARKPLQGTVAANVLAHGTGALNIDGCRIAASNEDDGRWGNGSRPGGFGDVGADKGGAEPCGRKHDAGRWPANLVHDGSDEVFSCFPEAPGQQRAVGPQFGDKPSVNTFGDFGPRGDFGSAARFFYCAKASREDRNDGCAGLAPATAGVRNASGRHLTRGYDGPPPSGNNHPTVKPTDLMRWLCRLVTPSGGLVLDPFMGSGSTGRAAVAEGMRFTGIELDPAYAAIAEARIKAVQPGLGF